MESPELDKPFDEEFARLREHNRKPVLWSGRVETAAGTFDCIALDLSQGGAKIRLVTKLLQDQAVRLVIDHIGSLRAVVVWTEAEVGIHSAGVRFTDPPEQVARALRRALPV